MSDELDISCLYGEPDLLGRVFLCLDLPSLLATELTCPHWRHLAISLNIWRRKLVAKQNSLNWRFALSQNDYSDLDHAAAKKLYFQLASVLVPDNVGFFLKDGNLVIEHEYYSEQYQRNNTVTRFISKVKQYRHSKTEENLFFSARAKAAQMILSHLPRTTTLADPRQFCMSQILVFGPAAFPVLVTRAGAVVVAGAHYGRGRVVLLPHEHLLSHRPVMQGAMEWAGASAGLGQDQIMVDPVSYAWSRLARDWIPVVANSLPNPGLTRLARDKLLKVRPRVYITEAHYAQHSETLLQYVREGGGLVVGGHAWFWASNSHGRNSLLHHPGNQLLTHFGLALSARLVEHRDAAFPMQTAKIPSVKSSHYFYSVMRARGREYYKPDQEAYEEFFQHQSELELHDRFRDIVELNKQTLARTQLSSQAIYRAEPLKP